MHCIYVFTSSLLSCVRYTQLGGNFTFITHKDDPVPLVPPRFIGYQHSTGEVHIKETDDKTGEASVTVACPGQENENCIDGNSLLSTSISDHIGALSDNMISTHTHLLTRRPLLRKCVNER